MTRRSNNLTTALSIAALLMAQPIAALAQADAPSATTAEAPQTASLTLTFDGIKTPTGALMVALYDSQAGYESGKAARQEMIVVTGESATRTLQGLAPGTYAVKLFHDVNGDGRMNANPFGMPTEPYAFSNDAKGSMGPAKWDAASFTLQAGANAQTIHID
ncbi:MAG: hypothetical protein JWP35_3281 [Caulobacter sp.]|nr:hypothetical protein [Caulobacter sp.]